MIEALLYELDNNYEIPDSKISYISKYLLSNAYWGNYELSLFGNSVGILPTDKLLILSKEIFSRGKGLIRSGHNPRDTIRTIQNISYILIRNGLITESKSLLDQLEDKLFRQDFFFEKTRQLFFMGLIKLNLGEISIGKSQCEKAIQIMNLIGTKSSAKLHQQELNNILKKYI